METKRSLAVPLFLFRISIFVVMFMWTIDKLLRPEHAAAVYENFYFIGGLSHGISYALGIAEMILLAGFILGIQKKFTYGAVLLLHGISTISSYKQYLAPFQGPNLLFFAALPMLAACYALFILRDEDTLLTAGNK